MRSNAIYAIIDGTMVLQEVGSYYTVVDNNWPIEAGWNHEPNENRELRCKKNYAKALPNIAKYHLCQPIQWEPAHDRVGEELNYGKHGKNHPVRQPLGIIVLGGRLDGMNGRVGRIQKTDRVAHQLSRASEGQPKSQEANATWKHAIASKYWGAPKQDLPRQI